MNCTIMCIVRLLSLLWFLWSLGTTVTVHGQGTPTTTTTTTSPTTTGSSSFQQAENDTLASGASETVTPSTPVIVPIVEPVVEATSVLDVIALNVDTSLFREKLALCSSLQDTLMTQSVYGWTLLVPKNAALEEVYREELDTEEYNHHLEDLLSYHVVSATLVSSSWSLDTNFNMLNGGTVMVTSLDPLTINDMSTVVTRDLLADNGIVHIMDQMLLPSSFTMDIVSKAMMDPDLSIFVELLTDADMIDMFLETGPAYTVFVPNNGAFAKLDPSALASLREDMQRLGSVLSHHVAEGIWVDEELQVKSELKMLTGNVVTIQQGLPLMIDDATVISSNVLVKNGVIHIIDSVLLMRNNNTSKNSTTGGEQGTNNTTDTPSNTTFCDVCAGGEGNPDNLLAPFDNLRCAEWLPLASSWSLPDSEDCWFARSIASRYCDCPSSFGREATCDVCSGTVTGLIDNLLDEVPVENIGLPVPELVAVTCGDLQDFPAVDGNQTCSSLYNKYSNLCCSSNSYNNGTLFDNNGTVWDRINEAPDMQLFRSGLVVTNLDKLLSLPNLQFTVFVPPDEGVRNDQYLELYSKDLDNWGGHATNIFEHHIVIGAALTREDIFNNMVAGSTLGTLAASCDSALFLRPSSQLVGGQSFILPDIIATNGIVHGMSGMLEVKWRNKTIAQFLEDPYLACGGFGPRHLQASSDKFNGLLQAMTSSSTGLHEALSLMASNGTTLVAPSDVAFDTSGIKPDDEMLLYHIINANLYKDSIASEEIVATKHPLADVWVTVDSSKNVRYNDAVVKTESLALNGVVHSTDASLFPPRMVEMLNITDQFTTINVSFLVQCFQVSQWDVLDLAGSLDFGQDTRFTLLAPVDADFDFYLPTQEERDRFLSPMWVHHRQDVLLNLLVDKPYDKQDLQSLFEMQMLGGTTYSVNSSSVIGSAYSPHAVRAVDGIIHFVDGLPPPPSLTSSVFDVVKTFPGSFMFLDHMFNASSMTENITTIKQMTLLMPTNAAFRDGTYTTQQIDTLLQNHVFLDLVFMDDWQQMNGSYIESMNGNKWLVEAHGGSVFILSAGGSRTKVNGGDLLFKDGVVHFVDSFLNESSVGAHMNTSFCDFCSSVEGSSEIESVNLDKVQCFWLSWEASLWLPDSEDCWIAHSLAARHCDCPSCVCSGHAVVSAEDAPIEIAASEVEMLESTLMSVTCGELQQFSLFDGNQTCSTQSNKYSRLCCSSIEVNPLWINASFLAYSQIGGTASDLAAPGNISTLNKAFYVFMRSVASTVETTKRQLSKTSSRRQLAASLLPESSEVFGLSDVDCAGYDGVPAGSSCQTVFAKYKVQLQGENEQEMVTKYETATQKALEEGKLQQSLDRIDPSYPYKVAAISDGPGLSPGTTMEWWVILFIVLGCLFGVCGLCFISAYLLARPEEKKKQTNDEIEARLMEGSMHEATGEHSNNGMEDSSTDSSPTVEGGSTPETPQESKVRNIEVISDGNVNEMARSIGQEKAAMSDGGESWSVDDGEWDDDGSPWRGGSTDNAVAPIDDQVHFAKMTNVGDAKKETDDDMEEGSNNKVEVWDDEDHKLGDETQQLIVTEDVKGGHDWENSRARPQVLVSSFDSVDRCADNINRNEKSEGQCDEVEIDVPPYTDVGGDVMASPTTDASSDESEFFDAIDSPLSDLNFGQMPTSMVSQPSEIEKLADESAGTTTHTHGISTNIDSVTRGQQMGPSSKAYDGSEGGDEDRFDDDDDDALGIPLLRSELDEIDRRASESLELNLINPRGRGRLAEPDEEDAKMPALPHRFN